MSCCTRPSAPGCNLHRDMAERALHLLQEHHALAAAVLRVRAPQLVCHGARVPREVTLQARCSRGVALQALGEQRTALAACRPAVVSNDGHITTPGMRPIHALLELHPRLSREGPSRTHPVCQLALSFPSSAALYCKLGVRSCRSELHWKASPLGAQSVQIWVEDYCDRMERRPQCRLFDGPGLISCFLGSGVRCSRDRGVPCQVMFAFTAWDTHGLWIAQEGPQSNVSHCWDGELRQRALQAQAQGGSRLCAGVCW